MSGRAVLLAVALVLAGCSSTPTTRFHSLLPDAAALAPATLPASPAWELMPVTVPAAVQQAAMVVRLGDDTLAVLEQDRWIAPPADELRAAIAQRLERAALAPAGKPWRIEVEVTRFDSLVGRGARVDAEWSLRQPGAEGRRCRASFQESAAAGVPALAAAHRAAAAALGDALAASLRNAMAGTRGC